MLLSFGGDNHFIDCTAFSSQTPMMGINSDPQSSTGALLYFETKGALAYLRECIKNARLSLEHWPRMETQIHESLHSSNTLTLASSEINIHHSFQGKISDFLVRKQGDPWERLKCSGLILATGSGSQGWYRNAHPQPEEAPFPKQSKFFRALARESEYAKRRQLKSLSFQVNPGEVLEVFSYIDGEIILDANPRHCYPFPSGSLARFWLSPQELRVIAPPG